MCTGVEIAAVASAALAAAGTGVSMKAASDSRSAMNKQVINQLDAQNQFQKQASPFFEQSLQKSSKEHALEDIATGKAFADQQYRDAAQIPGATSPLPTGSESPMIVGQARSNAAQQRGYDEAALQGWLKNQNVNQNLGVISNLANASAGTSPILTQLAGQKGAQLAGIGSLMSTAGNLAGVYSGIKAGQANAGQRQFDLNKVSYK
jgi:hypothetical protein